MNAPAISVPSPAEKPVRAIAPVHISSIKPILFLSIAYLIGLFAFAKITGIHYGKWTYTIYWIPAYVVNAWMILTLIWVRKAFSLPRRMFLLCAICYCMFLAVGLGYDWLMIFAGTWYFDPQSVLGINVISGTDIFGKAAVVPLEEFIFDLTFLPFGFLVVVTALFKMYSITIVLQPGRLHFKSLFTYIGFQDPTTLRVLQVDDLNDFLTAYDPRDASKYEHLIRKDLHVVEGTPIARLFPFIRF
jgi:hypothetical protein